MELNASYQRAIGMLPPQLARRASDLTSAKEGGTWRVCDADGELLAEVKGDSVRLVNSRTGQAASQYAGSPIARALSAYNDELTLVLAEALAQRDAVIEGLHERITRLELGSVAPAETRRLELPFVIRKFASAGKRVVTGVASTSDVDRQGDIVEASGGVWTLPLPALWSHRHEEPVGHVRAITRSARELRVEAVIAEGTTRADEVWRLIEQRAVTSFSIGFRPIQSEPIPTGRRFTQWELLEVSIVAVPANQNARIDQ